MLAVDSWKDTRIDYGTLGCPVCHSRYPIADSVVDFRPEHERRERVLFTGQATAQDPTRLLAQLDLRDPGGLLLLTGRYTSLAEAILAHMEVTCLLIDATARAPAGAVELVLANRLPLVGGSLRAAAVNGPCCTEDFVREIVRSVRAGGRIVGPVECPWPDDLRVLAQDASEWVAEVGASPNIVPLRRSAVR